MEHLTESVVQECVQVSLSLCGVFCACSPSLEEAGRDPSRALDR